MVSEAWLQIPGNYQLINIARHPSRRWCLIFCAITEVFSWTSNIDNLTIWMLLQASCSMLSVRNYCSILYWRRIWNCFLQLRRNVILNAYCLERNANETRETNRGNTRKRTHLTPETDGRNTWNGRSEWVSESIAETAFNISGNLRILVFAGGHTATTCDSRIGR